MVSKRTWVFRISGRLHTATQEYIAFKSGLDKGMEMLAEDSRRIIEAINDYRVPSFHGRVAIDIDWVASDMSESPAEIQSASTRILHVLYSYGVLSSDRWNGIDSVTNRFYLNKTDPHVTVTLREV